MTNATPNGPWSEIAFEAAHTLTDDADQLSRTFLDALAQVPADRLPDFHSRSWRYELCIFIMFWFWYVANSPKFCRAGGTKPLVDAYHRACYKAFVEAGLIGTGEDSLRQWEVMSKLGFSHTRKRTTRTLFAYARTHRSTPLTSLDAVQSVGFWRITCFLGSSRTRVLLSFSMSSGASTSPDWLRCSAGLRTRPDFNDQSKLQLAFYQSS